MREASSIPGNRQSRDDQRAPHSAGGYLRTQVRALAFQRRGPDSAGDDRQAKKKNRTRHRLSAGYGL